MERDLVELGLKQEWAYDESSHTYLSENSPTRGNMKQLENRWKNENDEKSGDLLPDKKIVLL